MNAAEFKKLVTQHFAPRIRSLGWKGSGFHFRKQEENHVVRVFGFQGSWYGGSVCCETAVHFDFIPDLAGRHFSKTTHASCLFRKRLTPNGQGDYHWDFHDEEELNTTSINQIWDSFERVGLEFYKSFNEFPEPFDSVSPEDFLKTSHDVLGEYHISNDSLYALWLFKEINLFLGHPQKAKKFAEMCKTKVYDSARIISGKRKGELDHDYVKNMERLFKI